MAELFLAVIPADPRAAAPKNTEILRETLASLCKSPRAKFKDYGKLQFIDCGVSFKGVACPVCENSLSLETWKGWMDSDWHGEEGFHLHAHNCPHCAAEVTSNDLLYEPVQGFACWFVSAETSREDPLTNEEVAMLESIAGLKLRAISQRY